jgi:hypothetical protein
MHDRTATERSRQRALHNRAIETFREGGTTPQPGEEVRIYRESLTPHPTPLPMGRHATPNDFGVVASIYAYLVLEELSQAACR